MDDPPGGGVNISNDMSIRGKENTIVIVHVSLVRERPSTQLEPFLHSEISLRAVRGCRSEMRRTISRYRI